MVFILGACKSTFYNVKCKGRKLFQINVKTKNELSWLPLTWNMGLPAVSLVLKAPNSFQPI